jgi:hypothetical protein
VLPFSSNPTGGSRPGGAAAWVSAWRGDDVGLGLEELRRGSRPGGVTAWVSAWRSCDVGLGLEELWRRSRPGLGFAPISISVWWRGG